MSTESNPVPYCNQLERTQYGVLVITPYDHTLISSATPGNVIVVGCAPVTVLLAFCAKMNRDYPNGMLYEQSRDDIINRFAAFVQDSMWPTTPEGWVDQHWYKSTLEMADLMASANESATDEFKMLVYDGVTRRFDLPLHYPQLEPVSAPDSCYLNDWFVAVSCAPKQLLEAFVRDYRHQDWPSTKQIRQRFAIYIGMPGEELPTTIAGWLDLPQFRDSFVEFTGSNDAPPETTNPADRYYDHIVLTNAQGEPMYVNRRVAPSVAPAPAHAVSGKNLTSIYLTGGPLLLCKESVDEVMALLYPEPDFDEKDDEEPLQPRMTNLTFSEAVEYMRQGLAVSRAKGFTGRGVKLHLSLTNEPGTQGESVERFVITPADDSRRPAVERTMYADDLLADDWYVVSPPAGDGEVTGSATSMSFRQAMQLVLRTGLLSTSTQ